MKLYALIFAGVCALITLGWLLFQWNMAAGLIYIGACIGITFTIALVALGIAFFGGDA